MKIKFLDNELKKLKHEQQKRKFKYKISEWSSRFKRSFKERGVAFWIIIMIAINIAINIIF